MHGAELFRGIQAQGCSSAGERSQVVPTLADVPGSPGPARPEPDEPGFDAEPDPLFAWAGLGFDDPG